MYIVYLLKSRKESDQYYIGLTQNLYRRLKEHNNGESSYSKRFAPWEVETFVTFKSKLLAENFEKYLKVGSGQAFLKKRLIPS